LTFAGLKTPWYKTNTEGTENSEGHRGKMFFRYGGRKERKNREKPKLWDFAPAFVFALSIKPTLFSVALCLSLCSLCSSCPEALSMRLESQKV
jgi:hypothetical protein